MKFDVNEIISYYRSKLQEFGSSAKGMDWKNEETQYLRFDIISRYIDFSSKPSVLDVGCGNGEFLNYCNLKGLPVKYVGLDVIPEMVELTRKRFGNESAILGNILSLSNALQFDYVIASGTFNAKLTASEDMWREYFFENIRSMFGQSVRATVFNCMSHHVDYRYDRLYYATEEEISNFAIKNLSRKYIIDHSYPLFEMTIAIIK
jgi:SAM-dependent methyltransferase